MDNEKFVQVESIAKSVEDRILSLYDGWRYKSNLAKDAAEEEGAKVLAEEANRVGADIEFDATDTREGFCVIARSGRECFRISVVGRGVLLVAGEKPNRVSTGG